MRIVLATPNGWRPLEVKIVPRFGDYVEIGDPDVYQVDSVLHLIDGDDHTIRVNTVQATMSAARLLGP